MIFQEFDCPQQGVDIDLHDENIAVMGELVYCTWCDQYHEAGKDGPTQTAIEKADGSFEWRGLPKDVAEKKAWLHEAATNAFRLP